jgi:3-phenylpropionate/trans-cinnamate dioxygenase ferredoxin reductase subunit
MSPRSVTVVGASLAGLSAARALRAQGFEGRVTVVGDEAHEPYDRPPLSKAFLAGELELADLALTTDEDEALDLDWRLGVRAVALRPADRAVELADGTQVASDGVVVATGARARTLPGAPELGGVHVLRTLDDALALRASLPGASALVVVGAGFVGAEVASTARALGLDVTVVEALPTPLAGPLGVEMGAACAALHADHGVRLVTGVGVAGLRGGATVEAVDLADGTRLPADVVVVGIGTLPNVEWVAGSGLELAGGGGVVTDATCATGIPGVVAVGDCAASYDVHARRVVRAEHWTSALRQPATAAATLLGAAPEPFAEVPYFWSEQYGKQIQFAGTRDDADALTVVEGAVADRSFVAVWTREGRLVAVLGVDCPRPFSAWRRALRKQAALDLTAATA